MYERKQTELRQENRDMLDEFLDLCQEVVHEMKADGTWLWPRDPPKED